MVLDKRHYITEGMNTDGFKDGAIYDEITKWVQEHYGFHVTNLNIAQVKRKCGIELAKNYNLPKLEDSKQPKCPKEKAIIEAFRHF
jgi:hypothetical protein